MAAVSVAATMRAALRSKPLWRVLGIESSCDDTGVAVVGGSARPRLERAGEFHGRVPRAAGGFRGPRAGSMGLGWAPWATDEIHGPRTGSTAC